MFTCELQRSVIIELEKGKKVRYDLEMIIKLPFIPYVGLTLYGLETRGPGRDESEDTITYVAWDHKQQRFFVALGNHEPGYDPEMLTLDEYKSWWPGWIWPTEAIRESGS